jgi:hypothetical protein
MTDEEVGTMVRDASFDMDDETSVGPRGTVYKAKVIRKFCCRALKFK